MPALLLRLTSPELSADVLACSVTSAVVVAHLFTHLGFGAVAVVLAFERVLSIEDLASAVVGRHETGSMLEADGLRHAALTLARALLDVISDHRGVARKSVAQHTPSQRLRLLLDTNVYIAVEPFSGGTEAGLARAATLVRLASEQGHTLLVHPATRDDLLEGKDSDRRRQRLAELNKYSMLAESPITTFLQEHAGASTPGSNDHRDLRLLAALAGHAATYLISEDSRLRRRARRAGLRDATLTIDEAIALLEGLRPQNPTPPPHVTEIPAYVLDVEQDMFDSLRVDYGPDFDRWLDKVRADSERRICLVVLDDDDKYAALAILKEEDDCEYSFRAPVMKISTFKVAAHHAGAKYGELLLKSIFRIAARKQGASF